jgi:hypothetical protein
VGDLFNYAAPGEETVCSEEVDSWMSAPPFQVSSLSNGDCAQTSSMEQFDTHDQRLTDGGYQEDVAAYCFYARQNYTKGEQVLETFKDVIQHKICGSNSSFLLIYIPNGFMNCCIWF